MDPFSFLDDAPVENGEQHDIEHDLAPETEPSPQELPHKRSAILSTSTDDEADSPVSKKPRLALPKPVVVDEFETEAKREVAASAGLTGGVEAGSLLELRHQVMTSRCLSSLLLIYMHG